MLELLIIVICLLVNSLLAAAEIAFVAVNRPFLRELVRQGHTKAQLLLRLRDNPERTLSVVQVGITLVGVLAGAVGEPGAEELLSPGLQKNLGITEATADTIAIGIVVRR
jgi:putative hemolysin